MTTKEQERKALEKIRKIVEELGENSYVGTAFDGCFEIAEDNIENDFGCSMKQRWETARAESDWRGVKIDKLQKETCGLKDRAEMLDGKVQVKDERINELLEEQIRLSNQLTEARSKIQDAEEACRAANQEILKLKAKLYDHMVAKED